MSRVSTIYLKYLLLIKNKKETLKKKSRQYELSIGKNKIKTCNKNCPQRDENLDTADKTSKELNIINMSKELKETIF